jgi:hypothetical protein
MTFLASRNLLLLFGRSTPYANKVLNTAAANLIAYYPLNEKTGTTLIDRSSKGRNGTSTGFDLSGYAGIGDGNTAPLLDGVNDFGNIYSAGLAADFNGAAGTVSLWFRMASAGVWSDGITRRALNLQADANNRVLVQRSASANAFNGVYIAGGTTKTVSFTGVSSLDWMHFALTWNKPADQLIGYLNGVASTPQTGLGTFVGALASTVVLIGAGAQTPTFVSSGYLAHVALWSATLSASQISSLAQVN